MGSKHDRDVAPEGIESDRMHLPAPRCAVDVAVADLKAMLVSRSVANRPLVRVKRVDARREPLALIGLNPKEQRRMAPARRREYTAAARRDRRLDECVVPSPPHTPVGALV